MVYIWTEKLCILYIYITCFNAALTWEFCAKSVALLLWDTDWVAGNEGLIGNDCDEECRPKETFKYIFFPVTWPVFPKLTLHFSFLKHFHCKYTEEDIFSTDEIQIYNLQKAGWNQCPVTAGLCTCLSAVHWNQRSFCAGSFALLDTLPLFEACPHQPPILTL